MGISRRRLLVILLVWFAAVVVESAAAEEMRVSRGDGRLWVRYRVEGLFDDSIWSSLRSGLPGRVQHHVKVWERRSPLWDRRVAQWDASYRIVFDLLDETYDVFDAEGLLESNLDPPEVVDRVLNLGELPVADLDDLDPDGRYYVEVEVEVEPLTVDEVRDLERWLGGRHGDSSTLGRLSSQVVGMFKSRVGLGERRRSLRSDLFRREELKRLPESPRER
jgi:hypothetical protein